MRAFQAGNEIHVPSDVHCGQFIANMFSPGGLEMPRETDGEYVVPLASDVSPEAVRVVMVQAGVDFDPDQSLAQ